MGNISTMNLPTSIKKLFENPKVIKITIFVFTLLIIFGFLGLIYFKDEPKFIPKETRGQVREGINEDIVKPIETILPPLGKAIQEAEYKDTNAGISNTSSGFSGSSGNSAGNTSISTSTADWKTYKNEKYGYEIKYPEGYIVDDNNITVFVSKSTNQEVGIWIYANDSNKNAKDWWESEKQKYSNKFVDTEVSLISKEAIKAETGEGINEIHYIIANKGKIFDILIIGPVELEEIVKTIVF